MLRVRFCEKERAVCGTEEREMDGANEGGQGERDSVKRSERSGREWREAWGTGRCFQRRKPSNSANGLVCVCGCDCNVEKIAVHLYVAGVGGCVSVFYTTPLNAAADSLDMCLMHKQPHPSVVFVSVCIKHTDTNWETSDDFRSPAEYECAVSAFKPLPSLYYPLVSCLSLSQLVYFPLIPSLPPLHDFLSVQSLRQRVMSSHRVFPV